MSDLAKIDEDSEFDFVDVDIRSWVESIKTNPELHRDRQVTEILLSSIGLIDNLKNTLVLKGGTAMALAFESSRVTADVDFSSSLNPADFTAEILEELNNQLPKTAIKLGYIDLICKVQSVKKMPRPLNFENADFPALLVRIGSARRGTGEEPRLQAGQATRVLDVEISFRDQVYAFQELNLTDAGVAVRAFTLHEIIAEKMRALLQQPIRKRNRRQDVYDIAYLLDSRQINEKDKEKILQTLVEKCRTRNIVPTEQSMDDPEVIRRAKADWDTLAIELGELPPFEERFAIMHELYASLPWSSIDN